MQRSGREFQIDWPNWLIIILLLIGVFVLTTADAAGLMGTPPIAIDVRAEPIAAFDKHNSSRIRFGQLEFRGALTLSSSYRKFGGLSAIRLALDGAHFISVNDHGRWFRGTLIYEEARPAGIADAMWRQSSDLMGSRASLPRTWRGHLKSVVHDPKLHFGRIN